MNENKYFKFNRLLLLLVGLWPYRRSKLVHLQPILFSGILSTFIVFQFTTFMTSEFTPDLVIKVFASAFIFITCTVMYNIFWIKAGAVKCLLEQLQQTYNGLQDENEVAIMEMYGSRAKRYTIGFTLLCVCRLSTFIFLQIGPPILNVLLSINQSRPYRLSIITGYFFDKEKYFYIILLHMNVALCIGTVGVLAIGMMVLTYLQHGCGMFKIASYRIEQAITVDILTDINLNIENIVYKRMSYAIDIHCRAMKFSELILSSFEGLWLFSVTTVVICMSLNLFLIIMFRDDTEQFLMHLDFLLVSLSCAFFGNYIGQEITDHNNYVFITAYNVQWYTAPVHIQRLILFLLQRGSRAFILNVGGLFVGSLESFATLVSTSISYFTVLYSIRG